MAELDASWKKTTSKHLRSARTMENYDGHVRRARTFLAERVEDARIPIPPDPAIPLGSEEWNSETLKTALDETPNELSPTALALYITFKSVEQGCKSGTAEQIRAAFKNIWDQSCVPVPSFNGSDC